MNSNFFTMLKNNSKGILYILFILLLTNGAYAGQGDLTNVINAKASIKSGAQLKVKDPFLKTSYKAVNYYAKVRLVYGREDKKDLETRSNWSFNVTYSISYLDSKDKVLKTVPNNTLSISYNQTTGVYEDFKIFTDSYLTYGNVFVTVNNPVESDGTSAPETIRLELSLVPNASFDLNSSNPSFQVNYNPTDRTLYWSYLKGASSYHVEWVYIDSEDHDFIALVQDPFLYTEPVRINTSEQYYTLNFTYPKGQVFARVRGVGKFVGSQYGTEKYSDWVNCSTPIITETDPGFEPLKNWQSLVSFAEEGKYKKVVNYFDGSLHSRQIVTNLSTEKSVLIGETKYDNEGRPVVNVLPVPFPWQSLTYINNLNTFNNTTKGKSSYDQIDVAQIEGLSISNGASNYYSPSNKSNDYLPDAQTYPYTLTRYTLDGTGRVASQTGLGATMKAAKLEDHGKNTYYFYNSAGASELQRLFGTNVGEAKHYKKNAVVDPNGQVSISYVDMTGKVIATALAGNNPENLFSLSSNVADSITENMKGDNHIDLANNVSRSESKIFNAVNPTEYTFNYDLKGVINSLQGTNPQVCKECVYDLSITIYKPDGSKVNNTTYTRQNIRPSQVDCSQDSYSPSQLPITATFIDIGTYTVVKELKLVSGEINNALTLMQFEPGYPKLSDYVTKWKNKIDRSSCDLTCKDHCLTLIYSQHPTWDPENALYDHVDHSTAITGLLNTCMTDNCGPLGNNDLDEANQDKCVSILNQIQADVDAGLYATVQAHAEYCQYTSCMERNTKVNGISSDDFDAQLSWIGSFSAAVAQGYLDPTTKDPYFANGIHSTERSYVTTKLTNYFDESNPGNGASSYDFNGDGFITMLTLEQYVKSPSVAGSDDAKQWNVYSSIYIGLKNDANTSCPYSNSDNAIVGSGDKAPTTLAEMELKNNADMAEACSSGCQSNVDMWMGQLETNCRPISATDYTSISTNLLTYCTNHCGSLNPLGALIKQDIPGDANLQTVQAILSTYGCSLESIAIDNPYPATSCDPAKYSRFLTSCAIKTIEDINTLVSSSNTNQTTYIGCPSPSTWKPGEIAKVPNSDGNTYAGFFPMNSDCNFQGTCASNYVYIINDYRTSQYTTFPQYISFKWDNGTYSPCDVASQYKLASGCTTNNTYKIRFYYYNNTVQTFVDLSKIISISNPFIDYTANYDNANATGVAVNITMQEGTNVVTRLCYIDANADYHTLRWKTDPQDISNLSECSVVDFGSCPPHPQVTHDLHFDGVDDYVDGGKISFNDSFTIEAWIKFDDVNTQNANIVSLGCLGNTGSGLVMEGTYLKFILNGFSGIGAPVNPGTWYHFSGVYDKNTGFYGLYKSDYLVLNSSNVSIAGLSQITIGGGLPGCTTKPSFKGSIDEVRIWNTARTPQQIHDNMNCPLSGPQEGLVAYWKFDEGTGNYTYDQSGSGHHASLHNGPSWENATNPISQCNSCLEKAATAILTVPAQNQGTGPELIAHGDFSSSIGWFDKYDQATDVAGRGGYTNLSGVLYNELHTDAVLVPGKNYRLTFYASIPQGQAGTLSIYNQSELLQYFSDHDRPVDNQLYSIDFNANGTRLAFQGTGSSLIGMISVKEIYPSFTKVTVYENATPLLTTSISYTDASGTASALASALNAATTHYSFTAQQGQLLVQAKAGLGKSVNGTSLSLRGVNDGVSTTEVLNDAQLAGGRDLGDCCDDIFTFNFDLDKRRSDCRAQQDEMAQELAQQDWQAAVDNFRSNFINDHVNKCFSQPFEETFTYTYSAREYHYTLYYYDQAGNLIQTLPPVAVSPLANNQGFVNGIYDGHTQPPHNLSFATNYQYNSLNQLIWQKTPDAGETNFWYNSKGELRLSQNAKQVAESNSGAGTYNHSYTNYDAQGRIIEVGQAEAVSQNKDYLKGNKVQTLALLDDPNFPSGTKTYVTKTNYDSYGTSKTITQDNLRGRAATVTITENSTATPAQTIYSYDVHGNVKLLTQKVPGLGSDKQVAYKYDLISGKVDSVFYGTVASNNTFTLEFAHAYNYDADNRITSVKTSYNGYLWEEDARYFYYKHGPLSRVELGEDKVQGLDYYYTIQGWMKGINIPAARTLIGTKYIVDKDPSQDGFDISTNANHYVAQDKFAYAIGYFNGDYVPVGASVNLGAYSDQKLAPVQTGILGSGLYNGNISWTMSQVHDLGYSAAGAAGLSLNQDKEDFSLRASAYQYDQLNRLINARSYNYSNGLWGRTNVDLNSSANDASYSYDANGNIFTAKVNNNNGVLMDNLTYNYSNGYNVNNPSNAMNNKLRSVSDAGTSGTTDINNQSNSNSYDYDGIGNLVQDISEEIGKITWTPYGKVKSVERVNGSTKDKLVFSYDAMGNRIMKQVLDYTGAIRKTSYYVRDASGNVMATYDVEGTKNNAQYPIYGSSRVGIYNAVSGTTITSRKLGVKTYEISNHLGNVMTVLSDIKYGEDPDGNGVLNYYIAQVKSASDYYAFGMEIADRGMLNGYRYGFNGKEHDGEWNGGGAMYDYGFRIYDPRIARFLSVDPLASSFAWNSPYSYAEGSPIAFIDQDGLEKQWYSQKGEAVSGAYTDQEAARIGLIDFETLNRRKRQQEKIVMNNKPKPAPKALIINVPRPSKNETVLKAEDPEFSRTKQQKLRETEIYINKVEAEKNRTQLLNGPYRYAVIVSEGIPTAMEEGVLMFLPELIPYKLNRLAKTFTVWDDIVATQPVYEGSVLPKSFELATANGTKVWVHGNATEHIAEFLKMKALDNLPESVRLATQEQLRSLQAAVNEASMNGIKYDQMLTVGGWELKFAAPREAGQLPALIHALPK